jgi:hypothetical protein
MVVLSCSGERSCFAERDTSPKGFLEAATSPLITIVALLARIPHTFSEQIAALPIEIASQVGEAVLHEHCPHPSEQQSQSAERRSVQKKCEESGLEETIKTGVYQIINLS